jgi:hypothetical protein
MPIALYDPAWRALSRETSMAGRLVASGLTALRRAESSVPAIYYEGFFGLTIGLERICKLIIVVSDFVHHGAFPTDAELKSKYGHDLASLKKEVQKRVAAGEVSTAWAVPAGNETDALVSFLTNFAKFNRYYNLSFLGGANANAEPISDWIDLVLKYHPQGPATPGQANNLNGMRFLDATIGHAFLISQLDDHGNIINNFESGAVHHLTIEHVQREGTMMCARLARSLADCLASLGYARTAAGDVLPVFSEYFGIILNEDNYLRGRKTFNYPR